MATKHTPTDAPEDTTTPAGARPTDPAARPAHHDLSVIGVMGMIGVGKTTLLSNAEQDHHIPVFKEYVVEGMLGDYIKGEAHMGGFPFQVSMMQSACARKDTAISLARSHLVPDTATAPLPPSTGGDAPFARLAHNLDANRVVLFERPPLENRIFALANRLTGGISHAEYGHYLRYVAEMIDQSRDSGVPQLNVFLWAPAEKTIANMHERGTESEQAYDEDHYLACLHHVYFLEFLAGATDNHYVVLDWTKYGNYACMQESVRAAVQEGRGAPVARVMHTTQVMDLSSTYPCGVSSRKPHFAAADELKASSGPTSPWANVASVVRLVPHVSEHSCVVHLDVRAYMGLSTRNRAKVQHIVFSHMSWGGIQPPTASCLMVHGMPDHNHLHEPKSVYAQDSLYAPEKIPPISPRAPRKEGERVPALDEPPTIVAGAYTLYWVTMGLVSCMLYERHHNVVTMLFLSVVTLVLHHVLAGFRLV